MCQTLAELRQALGDYATAFDPAVLSLSDSRVALKHATAIEHMAATIKALAAAKVADSAGPSAHARRVAANDLARETGSTTGSARDMVEVARRLEAQPEVAAAARRGQLSPAQTSAISDAAAADPSAEQRLVETALAASLSELRDECARTKAAAQTDPDKRRADIHAGRRLRNWTDSGGVWHLAANGLPERGAQLMAALGSRIERLFDEARRQDRRESPDAYAFDALIEMALDDADDAGAEPDPDHATAPDNATATDADADALTPDDALTLDKILGRQPGGPGVCEDHANRETRRRAIKKRRRRGAPVKLILRVDWDAFLRGVPIDGEVCELVGYGPVAMSAVHELLEMGDPFVAAVLTKGQSLVGVAHLGRQPTASQRTALEWLYPSCAVLGCPNQARLEIDHRLDWAKTHYTMLDLLDRLCHHHHTLKTLEGWALVEGTGKRAFVAPDDPRHPLHVQREDSRC